MRFIEFLHEFNWIVYAIATIYYLNLASQLLFKFVHALILIVRAAPSDKHNDLS